jgi:hypothetical protein
MAILVPIVAETKVGNSDIAVAIEKNVLRLEVSVDNVILGGQEGGALGELLWYCACW